MSPACGDPGREPPDGPSARRRPGWPAAPRLRGDRIVLAGAVLLLIDSLFSWQRECFDIPGFGAHCVGHNAWTGHGAIPGALMGGFAILLVAWEVLMLIGVPAPPAVPPAFGSAVLSFVTAGFAIVKFLIVVAYGPFVFAFAGVALALAISFGAYLRATAAAASSPPPTGPPA